nr:hypothetical protein [Klebsiella pneumoniae]
MTWFDKKTEEFKGKYSRLW